jgi:hypothetical protein
MSEVPNGTRRSNRSKPDAMSPESDFVPPAYNSGSTSHDNSDTIEPSGNDSMIDLATSIDSRRYTPFCDADVSTITATLETTDASVTVPETKLKAK